MSKKILYQDNARRALERGMEIMVEAVSVTLGPKGRNVVLEKPYGSPQIVNDGVTIAKEIKLEDHIENTPPSISWIMRRAPGLPAEFWRGMTTRVDQ